MMAHARRPLRRYKYCTTCDKVRKFKYNRVIGHGCCMECGMPLYIPPMSAEQRFKLKKLERAAWAVFERGEWKRPDQDLVERCKPRWLKKEELEKERLEEKRKCRQSKKP